MRSSMLHILCFLPFAWNFTSTAFRQQSSTTTFRQSIRLASIDFEARFSPSSLRAINVPEHTHILILPGFATESEDYLKPGSLAPNLKVRGWQDDQIHVLPIQRLDWAQILLKGMMDLQFWKGTAAPNRPAYCWYLSRVAGEIRRIDQQVKKEHGQEAKAKIVLIGHSAGGWLARAAVGYGTQHCFLKDSMWECGFKIDIDNILGIVTLGSPHLPTAKPSEDNTGGALRATNERFPGAYFAKKIFYVTAAGNAVAGTPPSLIPKSLSEFAFKSYRMVTGTTGHTQGDGIVPVQAAHLEGAHQINLRNVFHSPHIDKSWYGSDNIVDQWYDAVMNQFQRFLHDPSNVPKMNPEYQ
jgi:pimeloyl-ACP methyl ester carboxylesterase